MSTLQKTSQGQKDIVHYLPAILKENKSGWIIEYYVTHPQTELMTRKQIRLSRIVSRYSKLSDARKYINGMINRLNVKLSGGWNPFYEGEDTRMYEKLTDAARVFLSSRAKELRKNTMRSYGSFVGIFIQWTNKNYPDIYASIFSHNHAIRYMDELFEKKSVGSTTYNNHLKMARAFFNWAKEKGSIKTRCLMAQLQRERVYWVGSSDLSLHIIINDRGEIISFVITQGNVDDHHLLSMESFAVSDMNKSGNTTSQIKECMHLYTPLEYFPKVYVILYRRPVVLLSVRLPIF